MRLREPDERRENGRGEEAHKSRREDQDGRTREHSDQKAV